MNQQLSWRTIVGYSLGDVANNFGLRNGGALPVELLHRRRWRRCRCGGHHAVTGAGIRCLRRRLCRTSGGQCEYPLGKIPPVFTSSVLRR
ncbi:glucuronide permease [Escherichia coli]|nr:glucuronide permease [Escherichia coli]